MAETLGEKLKQARKDRGISISEVSEQTRISALYLESIENDDYRPLPGGIFNKGFVRSFAKYIGIDEEEAMQDYAQISARLEGGGEKGSSKYYRPEVLTDDSTGPSMIPTIIFAVIILGLMTWGIFALVNYLESSQSQTAENNTANTNVNTNAVPSNSNVSNSRLPSQPISTDEIKVKITTSASELSITSVVDGKREIQLLNSQVREHLFEAADMVRLNYYKGLADTVELTVNGKKIETPIPPPDYKKNGFEYEINMNNLKQILRDGKINVESANESAATNPTGNDTADGNQNTAQTNANTAAN